MTSAIKALLNMSYSILGPFPVIPFSTSVFLLDHKNDDIVTRKTVPTPDIKKNVKRVKIIQHE